jgi:poly(A) polymerase
MELLPRSAVKVVATGLAHGTVTAVVDHVGHEITTLRRDIDTDGRHAHVAFTDDWREDAARRDFTMNALYADSEGVIYDYFDGISDARAGRVRFIGAAADRIREDVLRILRYFRFFAWFGQGAPDAEALTACRELSSLMSRLSAERVARETIKLLSAPDPRAAWRLLLDAGAAADFMPQANDLSRLDTLLGQEQRHAIAPDGIVRLAALLPDASAAAAVAARLKLSRRDTDRLTAIAGLPADLQASGLDDKSIRRHLYRHGVDAVAAALLLLRAEIGPALRCVASWENPTFPLSGQDIVALGIPAGPLVGVLLKYIENWWIEGDFRADRATCLAQAREHESRKNP